MVKAIAGMDIVGLVVSLFLSSTAHVVVYGPIVGVGYTAMLFFHEAGHAIALYRRGYLDKEGALYVGMLFIPFIGAILRMGIPFHPTRQGSDDEAFVGISGPLLGIASTFVVYLIWIYAPESDLPVMRYFADKTLRPQILNVILMAVSFNQFNLLITVPPFDGGRCAQAISPFLRVKVGLFGLAVMTVFYHEPWICLPWMFGLMGIRFTDAWTRKKFGMTAEWTRACVTMILFVIQITWMIVKFRKTEDAELYIEDIMSVGMGALTAISGLMYVIGGEVSFRAIPPWRAIVILFKKALGTYVEREVDVGGRRLGQKPKPDILPETEYDGTDRRGRDLTPEEEREKRRFHIKWGVRYVCAVLLHFIFFAAVLYSFGRLNP
jgi:Zn-dependent protease